MEAICVYHTVDKYNDIRFIQNHIELHFFASIKLFPSNLSNYLGPHVPTLRKCTNHGRSVQHFGSREVFLSMGIGCGCGFCNVETSQ